MAAIIINCKQCGEEFVSYDTPSYSDKVFCSQPCYWTYKKGRPTGRQVSKETRRKIGEANRKNGVLFSKGQEPWNKGKKWPEMAGENNPFYGKKHIEESLQKMRGDKNWMWKGGISDVNQQERQKFCRTVRLKVIKRDNYTCQRCGTNEGYMHVDHIKSWSEYPELRFNPDNCRTLCVPCHYYITHGREMPKDSSWGLPAIYYQPKEMAI